MSVPWLRIVGSVIEKVGAHLLFTMPRWHEYHMFHMRKRHQHPLWSIKKLEIRYSAVYNRDLSKLENRTPFPVAPWWRAPKTTVAASTEEAIATHDRLVEEGGHFSIYTNGSGIEDKVGASAVTVFTPIPGEVAITLDKK